MPPYPCIESTLDIQCGEDKVVRLWIEQDDVPEVIPAHRRLVTQIREQVQRLKGPDFFAWLQDLFAVNGLRLTAAQLMRQDPRNTGVYVGTVVYYVDFDKDPHG